MSYPVVLLYPDADCTDTGQLYLPGEPVLIGEHERCGICSNSLTDRPLYWTGPIDPEQGRHLGYVQTTSPRPGLDEWCHLRCIFDCTDEGTLGMTTPGGSLPDSGRHHASAA